jgi:very-short-patch-repair endonuclease
MAKLTSLSRDRARQLRAVSTDAENALWRLLRGRRLDGRKFRRQLPIGPWIADFACVEARLIIEADGSQHGDGRDLNRDADLKGRGWRVLRFWNDDILLRPDSVQEAILTALGNQEVEPSPQPSPIAHATGEGRGEGCV